MLGASIALAQTSGWVNMPALDNSGAFVRNDGQWDRQALFLSRTPGVDAWVTAQGVVYDFHRTVDAAVPQTETLESIFAQGAQGSLNSSPIDPASDPLAHLLRVGHVVRLEFAGSSASPEPAGEERLPGELSYLLGSDPGRWATRVPRFGKSVVKGLYPGVDAVYYVDGGHPRYDLVVKPGADPTQIRFRLQGATSVKATADGRLLFGTRFGEFEQRELLAYQGAIRKPVPCRYRVSSAGEVSFELGQYDRRQPLTIDPLVWSTYLGGSGYDKGYGLAVDFSGFLYVVGVTGSNNFPTTVGAYDRTFAAEGDAFVTKMAPDGASIVWSTFLGGIHGDSARAIAVDESGAPVLAGITYSADFPTTSGAFSRTWKGNDDGFMTKLSADGSSLAWSTYYGGSTNDRIYALVLDPLGSPTVAGSTDSVDLPTTIDVFNRQHSGSEDAFVARFSADGSMLGWATYVGGSSVDRVYSLAIGPSGSAIAAGVTSSPDFPTTYGVIDRVLEGSESAFVTRICPDGSRLEWSTFLGGSGSDFAWALAVDGTGETTVGGITYSRDFPTTEGAFSRTFGGGYDGFVTRLAPFATSLVWSTYIGGSNTDWVAALTLDSTGATTIVGNTSSSDYPTTLDAYSSNLAGGYDATITRLSPNGRGLYWSSYLGGASYDEAIAVELDPLGNASIYGSTQSFNFPTTPGAYDRSLGGIGDVFLARLSIEMEPVPMLNPDSYTVSEDSSLTVPAPGVVENDQDAAGWSCVLVSAPSHGSVDLVVDGGFVYTPTPDFFGSDGFTYRLTKNGRESTVGSVAISVEPTDDPFNLQGPDTLDVDELELASAQFSASDLDYPGAVFAYRLEGAPPGAFIGTFSGLLSWTPTEEQGPGEYTFEVVATGNWIPEESVRKTLTIRVEETNAPPVVELPSTIELDELSDLSVQVQASDSDLPAQNLTFTLVSGPDGLSLSPTGLISWTPSEEQGPETYDVTISVSDGEESTSATMAVTVKEVNQLPVVDDVPNQSVQELEPLTIQVNAQDADLPAQILAYEIASGPDGASIDAAGLFTWTPSEEQGPGTHTVVVRVSDGYGYVDESFDVDVADVNAPPTLDLPASVEIDEMLEWTLQADGSDPDVPAQTLAYTLVSGPPGLAVSESGLISWTPSEEQGPGTYQATVSVSDGVETASDTIEIAVREANQPPTVDDVPNQSVQELEPLALQVSAHDADLPAQTLSYEIASGPDGASIDASGAFSWTPAEEQGPGTYTVVVRVSDGAAFADESFDVEVAEANLPPTLDLPASVEIDELLEWTLQADGSDPDLPAQTLSYTLVSGPDGLAVSPEGLISWTPTEEQGPGTYQATVSVSDGVETASDTIDITVREVNLPPLIGSPSLLIEIPETVAASIQLEANDPDVPPNMLRWELISGPDGLAVSESGMLTWAPTEADGPGEHPVVVRVYDNAVPPLYDEKTLIVKVNEVNRPPTITSVGPQTVAQESSLLLHIQADDPDLPKQTLVFTLENTIPAGATLTEDGEFSWTPSHAVEPGAYDIHVRVTDSYGASAQMVFTTTVEQAEHVIHGRVQLHDYVGDPATQTVVLEFRRSSDGATVYQQAGVPLASDGSFTLSLPAGTLPDDTYDVYCRGSHWLQQRRTGIVVLSQSSEEISFNLLNGDVDGDNMITVFDYNMLSDAFDSAEGDPNWNPMADLDGDGSVTVFDYNILSQNFDLVGDE